MSKQATGKRFQDHPPLGIDLGTTFCALAYLDPSGKPVTIPNRSGDFLTPSTLLFEEGDVVVGKEASKQSVMAPDAFAECFKRDIGGDQYRRTICGVIVPPEVLSGFLLQRLKEDAERQLGPIRRVVITVPAFFDEVRRKATQDAGRLAGLEVVDIINEPTAAAVAYGYEQGLLQAPAENVPQDLQRVLVYDLGGGTFDVTILDIQGHQFRALATDGDVYLGGKDFDERLVDHLADEFTKAHGVDPREDPYDAAQLWQEAQEAKHTLSERVKTTVVCYHGGLRHRVEITREGFERMTRDLLERTETTTSLIVKDAKLTWEQIDRVLLVGGSSRMPMVADMLHRVTGKEPDCSQSPDSAVAHGAAVYAGMLANAEGEGADSCRLENVNSHSLGIVGIDPRTGKQVAAPLIPKNTRLPCRAAQSFVTARDDQRSVKVSVIEGESHRPSECIRLGDCVVRDLPPGLPKGSPIHVEYSYAANGRISVSARLPNTQQSAHIEIERDAGENSESLDIWRTRVFSLTGGEGLLAAKDVDLSDPQSVMRRLDVLYAEVGKAALKKKLPKTLSRVVLAVKAAVEELVEANRDLKKAQHMASSKGGALENMRSKSRLAIAQKRLDAARVGRDFAHLAMGRECLAAGVRPAGVEPQIHEATQLQQRLGQTGPKA